MILMAAKRTVAADSSRVLMRVVQCAQPHACISILTTCNLHSQVIAASLSRCVAERAAMLDSFDGLHTSPVKRGCAAQATITYKWNCWAKRHLFIELGLYLTWLIAFQVFVLLFQARALPFEFSHQGGASILSGRPGGTWVHVADVMAILRIDTQLSHARSHSWCLAHPKCGLAPGNTLSHCKDRLHMGGDSAKNSFQIAG